jgi:hypothetical protein
VPGPSVALAAGVAALALSLVAVHAWRALGPSRAAAEILAVALYLAAASALAANHANLTLGPGLITLAGAVAVTLACVSLAARLWWLSRVSRSVFAGLLAGSVAAGLAPTLARLGSRGEQGAMATGPVALAIASVLLVFSWTFAAELGRGPGARDLAVRAGVALAGLAALGAMRWAWTRLGEAPPAAAWTLWAVLWGVPAVLAITGRAAVLPESLAGLLGSAGSRLPAAALILPLGTVLAGAAGLGDPWPAVAAAGPLLPPLALISTHPPLDHWRGRAFARLARVQDFVAVLMKPRNGVPWTAEDRAFLRAGVRTLARWAPGFVLFLLPGGMVLLGLYAWLLDRRRGRPPAGAAGPAGRRAGDHAA